MTKVKLALAGRAHLAVGLMSGTSHDGVSAACIEIDRQRRPPVKLIAFDSYPYPKPLRMRLLEASSGRPVGALELSALNFELGTAFARAATGVLKKARIDPARVSFIGSHGHTFAHLPPRRAGRGTASTLQLGESAVIAAATGIPVVADFRPMDIAVGGEGAPLAPLAHRWLFGDVRMGRIVQNIGGIANATYLPAARRVESVRPIAFDTGPGVMMIDALAARLSGGRMRMDRDGRLAAAGIVNPQLLAELMRNPYLRRKPPKSTGREDFGAAYLERISARAEAMKIDSRSLIATLTAFTAHSIADACRRFIGPLGRIDQLIVTGGGARNPVLMEMLRRELPAIQVMTAEQVGVDGDALESVAFAILGYQMLIGGAGNLPSVTGARAPAILGKLTLPPRPARG
ncbi:MAG: anhydro-N-acetylmuramic acid kinase [Candidatus Binataceae bacterium]|nr:anhydro-N-acetylmuramic acid kinase [Candidatus Binataceae bacterium]